ncbi:MAG: glycerophosphodiester phosphodiesterase [Oscillospiraceae bacterium]|nr:glycerophosphodiester phosphodiesterase [Oscillospiraceae bacterium]
MLLKLLAIPAAAAAGGLFCIAPKKAQPQQKQAFKGLNIAHRGLYSRDQSIPENSLAAFRAAAEAGYGVELDVHLTADDRVVVHHDGNLKRLGGVDECIEDKTYKELKNIRLAGTDEAIPLLSEVFSILGDLPVVLELKRSLRGNGARLCEKTLQLIRTYPGPVCVESFDPTMIRWFKKNAPDLLRGQLSGQTKHLSQDVPTPLAYILSHCMMNFLSRPNFIAYRIGKKPMLVKLSEKLGAMPVAWTSHDTEAEKKHDTVIFEHYLPRIRYK